MSGPHPLQNKRGPVGAGTPPGQESHLAEKRDPNVPNYRVSQRAITAVDTITIELVETDEMPSVVIVR
jgi:hypothetical protein